MLLVQVVNVVLHCDELQPVLIRDDDPDGNAGVFDYFFFMRRTPAARYALAMAN